jgi:hypothetical protein
MSLTICIRPTKTLQYLNGGGHLWVFLNWALELSLRARVIWLEDVEDGMPVHEVHERVNILKSYLRPFALDQSLALYSNTGTSLPADFRGVCLDLARAAEADLLLNFRYDTPQFVIDRFRRAALVDIDPGLLQVWVSQRLLQLGRHDLYFTIGETVGRPGAVIPDCGVTWHYTRPPVFLPAWPTTNADTGAPYTTVSQWWGEYVTIGGDSFDNSKRAAFQEYLDMPAQSAAPMELALCLGRSEAPERSALEQRGWRVRSAWDEIPTPEHYRTYVRHSRGEFSCAKPSCLRLENAWISDRTLCYLASGKPAVVQYTGRSEFLPDTGGLFRFRGPVEAAQALAAVEADYEQHAREARMLAEEFFDARRVVSKVLELALT